MTNVSEQPRILWEGNGEEETRLERESLALLARIKSDLDTSSFTLEDVQEGVSQRYRRAHLDFLVQSGFIEFDSGSQKYAVTSEGYEHEAEES